VPGIAAQAVPRGHADVTEHLHGGLVYRLHGGELGCLGCPYQHHIIVGADGSGINLVCRTGGAGLFRRAYMIGCISRFRSQMAGLSGVWAWPGMR